MNDFTKLTHKNFRDAERYAPDLWRKLNQRIYKNTEEWHDPRHATVSFCQSLTIGAANGLKPSMDYLYRAAEYLRDRKMPLYFVKRELLEALRLSSLPVPLDWEQMNMPAETLVFMLPKGAFEAAAVSTDVMGASRSEVPFIGITRQITRLSAADIRFNLKDPGINQELAKKLEEKLIMLEQMPEPPAGKLHCVEFPRISVFYTVIGSDIESWIEFFMPYDRKFPRFDQPPAIPDYIAEHMRAAGELVSRDIDHLVPESEIATAAHLAFGFIMAMNARPDLIEAGTTRGRRMPGSGREIWTPNVIGSKFRFKRESIGKDDNHQSDSLPGTSPRPHFRLGHLRNQSHGPSHSLRKEIWIEPVMVGVREE